MKILKIRRVGHSNVITIPREMEARGFRPGVEVVIDETEDGELRVVPADSIRERIRALGRKVVAENREALDILARHDRDK